VVAAGHVDRERAYRSATASHPVVLRGSEAVDEGLNRAGGAAVGGESQAGAHLVNACRVPPVAKPADW